MQRRLVWSSRIAGVAFVGFIAWGWIGWKDAAWWGAVGQWFGAVGSIVAAGVAVGIALEGWRRSDKERDDRDRIQARLVLIEYELPRMLKNADGDVIYGGDLDVRINNISGGFILFPTIEKIEYPHAAQGEWREEPLETFPRDGRLPLRLADRLEKNDKVETTLRLEDADGRPQLLTKLMNVTISFMDADGRQWFRRGAEEPQRHLTW